MPDRHVTLIFLDKDGALFHKKRVEAICCQRQTLELSSFIPESQGAYGTFCVFHSITPDVVTSLGSYIAERGYVSYRYKENPLRAYVHGNLDAVAMPPGRTLLQLGGAVSWGANTGFSTSCGALHATRLVSSIRVHGTSVSLAGLYRHARGTSG